ncbi:MAG: helix-turn-helix transcriptional regulator [Ruminococcus sp.]|nr:helix-turn-helix transcriptional regulator [Ruminococcus sp.]
MKITKIKTAEKNPVEIKGTDMQDYCLYIFRSPVSITLSGIERIFQKNTVILYEGGASRYFSSAGNSELKYDLVQFSPSPADMQHIGSLNIPINKPFSVEDDYILSSTIRNLDLHGCTAGRRSAELIGLYMRIILIALEEANSGEENVISDIPRFPQLKEIRREMYDNPQQHMSIDKLCRRLAVSRTYFHRIYQAAFGISFRQDEIKSRLMHACRLLTDTKVSVSVIAEKCGYESETFFMRQFRQHMGCTPSEYRRKG